MPLMVWQIAQGASAQIFAPAAAGPSVRLDRRFVLMRHPLIERRGGIDENPKAHVGVRRAAKLRALTVIFTGRICDQRDLVFLAGNDVALTANRRHEEAVDDILRRHCEVDRTIARDVDFVGRFAHLAMGYLNSHHH